MPIERVRATAVGVAIASALALTAWSASLAAQPRERSLRVTIVDKAGNDVPGLGPPDFIVREDKVQREVVRVTPALDAMQIALLVDDSPAVNRYLRDVRSALGAFITAIESDTPLDGKHLIALITLSSRPTIKVNYTSDQQALLKAANILPQPATRPTLLDGIQEAAEGLTKRHAARPVIVAVAPEVPDASFRVYDQVLEAIAKSGATFYVIGLGESADQRDRAIVLDKGTTDSGGTYQTLLASNSLDAKMTQLASHLTHQYLVTYAHPDRLIPPEHVTVSPKNPAFTARGTLVKAE